MVVLILCWSGSFPYCTVHNTHPNNTFTYRRRVTDSESADENPALVEVLLIAVAGYLFNEPGVRGQTTNGAIAI